MKSKRYAIVSEGRRSELAHLSNAASLIDSTPGGSELPHVSIEVSISVLV